MPKPSTYTLVNLVGTERTQPGTRDEMQAALSAAVAAGANDGDLYLFRGEPIAFTVQRGPTVTIAGRVRRSKPASNGKRGRRGKAVVAVDAATVA